MRDKILQVMSDVKGYSITPLDSDILLEIGLSSLELAIVVIKLEDELGVDPFEELSTWPVTFIDFVKYITLLSLKKKQLQQIRLINYNKFWEMTPCPDANPQFWRL